MIDCSYDDDDDDDDNDDDDDDDDDDDNDGDDDDENDGDEYIVGDLVVVSGHRDTARKLITIHIAEIQNWSRC